MKIILASGNINKFYEIKEIVKPIGIELLYGGDYDSKPEVEESGESYFENALIKAKAWSEHTNLPAMADDSGIEVNALASAPGINSARIVPGSDSDRVDWLLNSLKDKDDRSARFVCSIVVFFPKGEKIVTCEEYCYGKISLSPHGDEGFGYDPIFIPNGYDKTFAELGDKVKRTISHRTLAIKGIAEKLIPVIQCYTV